MEKLRRLADYLGRKLATLFLGCRCEVCGKRPAKLIIDAVPIGKRYDGKAKTVMKTFRALSCRLLCSDCRVALAFQGLTPIHPYPLEDSSDEPVHSTGPEESPRSVSGMSPDHLAGVDLLPRSSSSTIEGRTEGA